MRFLTRSLCLVALSDSCGTILIVMPLFFSIQNAKSKARKYRSTQVDYEACTVRITSVEENVKFVLICPDDVQAKMYPEEMQAFICGLMFKSGMASSCGGKGAMVTPPPPTTSEPLEPIT